MKSAWVKFPPSKISLDDFLVRVGRVGKKQSETMLLLFTFNYFTLHFAVSRICQRNAIPRYF